MKLQEIEIPELEELESVGAIKTILDDVKDIEEKGFLNNQKAEAVFRKFELFAKITEKLYREMEKSKGKKIPNLNTGKARIEVEAGAEAGAEVGVGVGEGEGEFVIDGKEVSSLDEIVEIGDYYIDVLEDSEEELDVKFIIKGYTENPDSAYALGEEVLYLRYQEKWEREGTFFSAGSDLGEGLYEVRKAVSYRKEGEEPAEEEEEVLTGKDDCEKCGDGAFNICDQEECEALGERRGCYYVPRWTCKSCSELWDYVDYNAIYHGTDVTIKDVESTYECREANRICKDLDCRWTGGECVCQIPLR